jgi:hypothetical protein
MAETIMFRASADGRMMSELNPAKAHNRNVPRRPSLADCRISGGDRDERYRNQDLFKRRSHRRVISNA